MHPALRELIRADGTPHFGRFEVPPGLINWQDYDARDAMGAPRASWAKPFLFKHFDFYGVQSSQFSFGCGLVRLGYINTAFVYLYSCATGLVHHSFDLPLDIGLTCDLHPYGESGWIHPLKSNHWVKSARTPNSRSLQFHWGASFHGAVQMSLSEEDQTLCMNTPVANTGFAYAQKTSGVPVSGELVYKGQRYTLNPKTDGCYHDWTAGFLRRDTFWNWACATGRLGLDGPLVSVNLANGVNETCAQENVLWINGKLHNLPQVFFEYRRDDVLSPWLIRSACGAVDLRFVPFDAVRDHRNFVLLASRFNQCLGVFSGLVRYAEDQDALELDGLKGWCEDHFARW